MNSISRTAQDRWIFKKFWLV